MRRLVLMRHAKSSWSSGSGSDHARPLNRRGRDDAPRIAEALVSMGWRPDHALVSDAARTRETFARMTPTLGELPVTFASELYLADVSILRDAIAAAPDVETLFMLGHNPGCEDLHTWLTGSEIPFATATAALLVTEVAWDEAASAPARFVMEAVVRPKSL